jgi:protein SCO1/2
VLIAQQIRGALDELGHRGESVAVLLLSPPPSSPRRASGGARARSLLDATSLAGRAQYLSGTSASLRAAWHAYGVVLPSAGRRAFLASPTIVVLDRRGFERVGFALEQLTPEGLAHDIDTLLGR